MVFLPIASLQILWPFCVLGIVPARALTRAGAPAECQSWYTAKANDTCWGVARAHELDVAGFESLNPQLSSDCPASLWAGYAYCVVADKATAAPPASTFPARPPPGLTTTLTSTITSTVTSGGTSATPASSANQTEEETVGFHDHDVVDDS